MSLAKCLKREKGSSTNLGRPSQTVSASTEMQGPVQHLSPKEAKVTIRKAVIGAFFQSMISIL
jgi:hypothetical protein